MALYEASSSKILSLSVRRFNAYGAYIDDIPAIERGVTYELQNRINQSKRLMQIVDAAVEPQDEVRHLITASIKKSIIARLRYVEQHLAMIVAIDAICSGEQDDRPRLLVAALLEPNSSARPDNVAQFLRQHQYNRSRGAANSFDFIISFAAANA